MILNSEQGISMLQFLSFQGDSYNNLLLAGHVGNLAILPINALTEVPRFFPFSLHLHNGAFLRDFLLAISPFLPPSEEVQRPEVLTSPVHPHVAGEGLFVHSSTRNEGAQITGVPMPTTAVCATNQTTMSNIAPVGTVDKSCFCPLPSSISSPIIILPLASYLSGHPDRELVDFLIRGFTDGFDIMYGGSLSSSYPTNLRSTEEFHTEVSSAIQFEVSAGHTAGPFLQPPFPITHCSPLGAVRKSPNSLKVRLILDLSQPRGASINEGILERSPIRPYLVIFRGFS